VSYFRWQLLERGSFPCHFQESSKRKANAFKVMHFAEITCAKAPEIWVKMAVIREVTHKERMEKSK